MSKLDWYSRPGKAQPSKESSKRLTILHFRPLAGWATCPSGHFIRGLHRGGGHQLNSIQWATCCKPALHPHWYKDCYDQNVSGDTMECSRNNFYVVGIHRGASHALSSINQLRCCNMYDGMCLYLPVRGLLRWWLRVFESVVPDHGLVFCWWVGGITVTVPFLSQGYKWVSPTLNGLGNPRNVVIYAS